ncbi:unnamed protein product [Eruca vesicaria subsp. sativa]|uniref:Uncharacterized protein n=1 Tax=Eruca vesicaria subsp. sativa TaxID=29727 RepID=A0ABC8JVM3_ERUVS|nr:unnamed protein product [Eruca vesicaria subsp. sativa]
MADKSTRRHVCPTLDPPIIKKVLKNFVPDEFKQHKFPRRLFDVVNSEGLTEEDNGCIIVSLALHIIIHRLLNAIYIIHKMLDDWVISK